MIPIIIIGICMSIIVRASFKDTPRQEQVQTVIGKAVDVTPHLTEFTRLIRGGHRPNQWLITEAVSEAYQIGDWKLVKAISENFPSTIAEKRKKKVEPKTEAKAQIEKPVEMKALAFEAQKTSSPIEGVNNDDWRMFVTASQIEPPTFSTDNSIGMFRQNKKRIAKLGIAKLDSPIDQYDAFEKEVLSLMNEGAELFKQSVAMPVEINGENHPMTLSGLLAVMRIAGTSNAAKWVDSQDERKKFPNTTEAFKRANGCF